MFFWREQVRPGLHVAFTSEAAGNLAFHVGDDPGATSRNRRALEASLGVVPGSLRFMNQTHSSVVADVGSASAGTGAGAVGSGAAVPADSMPADAMVCADGSVPLAVLVADCVPIVLADRRSSATAVVHAGRRGTMDGIVGRTVERLGQEGSLDLDAWIGPSVCGKCYEVPASMRDEVSAAVPSAAALTRHGTPSLDLPAAVAAQLRELGVTVRSLPEGSGAALSDSALFNSAGTCCTLENANLFSHRREPGVGRLAGLVWRS